MTLGLRLLLSYLVAVLAPVAVLMGFYLPERHRSADVLEELRRSTGASFELTERLKRASGRLVAATPPPKPPMSERLDRVAAVTVPGLAVRETGRDAASGVIRFEVEGGFAAVLAYLERLPALPQPAALRRLELEPLPAAKRVRGIMELEVDE